MRSLVFILLHVLFMFVRPDDDDMTSSPIIGILTQPVVPTFPGKPVGYTYIAASYVKYAEMAGARVVPILYDLPRDQIELLLNSINGVIFTGGDSVLVTPDGILTPFGETFKFIYDKAVEFNQNGDFFPIIGMCMGYQWILSFSVNETNLLEAHSASGVSLPLNFTGEEGSLVEILTDEERHFLSSVPSMPYSNHFGINPELFKEKLSQDWHLIATSTDMDGKEFTVIAQHKTLPFLATQFHPEKSIFEWFPRRNIIHKRLSIEITQKWSNLFNDLTRQNKHRFASPDQELSMLIYNYIPERTLEITNFEQTYFFPPQNEEIAKISAEIQNAYGFVEETK